MYLLHLLRWLRVHRPDAAVDVALLAGGDLLEPLRELAPVTVFEPIPPALPPVEQELVDRGRVQPDAVWATLRARALREMMAPFAEHRVVYVNSAPSIELALALPTPPEVMLSHVHELAIGLIHRMEPQERHWFLVGATRLFSVADAVTDELVRLHGRSPDVIERHPGMVEADAIAAAVDAPDRAEARRSRGIDPDHLVVGACGTIEPRKGTDLFLELAWQLARADLPAPVTCVWVGGDPDGIARAEARATALGLSERVRFVGRQDDPAAWFALFDVFVLPSREDPFPLVCIEAAAVGTPIVAFDTGGIPELLRQGCGEVAPYPDVSAMAGAVRALLLDDDRRHALGERGRELARDDHDVSVLAPRLWGAIERWT